MSRDLSAPEHRRLLLDSVRDYLSQLAEEGLEGLPATAARAATAAADKPASVSKPPAPAAAAVSSAGDSARAAAASSRPAPLPAPGELLSRYPGLEKTTSLEELSAFIGDCKRCKLAPLRTHLVFGVGNPGADLMFVGEAPGADEDARGEPFVGRAGQLLTDIIERGMGLKRSDVYICNVIKCRPPDNRNPESDEVAACEPFLMRQIDLVRPRAIVALGTFAVQALLKVKTPISRLRGNWHEVRGVKLMPTFHPAYLLRSPGEKRVVWQDIQEVMKLLGLEVPARGGAR
ncbi:MAG TPA: uracil-DNA glycosylase [Candidatus Binataceae bacterium]|nr:uracil-DNA glycosylase [Candidatus Binataceae bacterium]